MRRHAVFLAVLALALATGAVAQSIQLTRGIEASDVGARGFSIKGELSGVGLAWGNAGLIILAALA